MTNHWVDIDNASMVFVFGANPAENHPACFAHINKARFGDKKAQLVVVDPRRTRTALQCAAEKANRSEGDFYVRIRPGTNIAFINGVLDWIFDNAQAEFPTEYGHMLDWHNTANANFGASRGFIADASTNGKAVAAPALADWQGARYVIGGVDVATTAFNNQYPKYCDTRFKINATNDDYERATLKVGTNSFHDFPIVLPDVEDDGTVWRLLKDHVKPYGELIADGSKTAAADICGCSDEDIADVARALMRNSRHASSDWNAATATPNAATYKATTILYAMGQTQHTSGSQNIKGLAQIQSLLGNMGRAGGGINALRGIHNVQGSTDMGLLYTEIPGYSGNPATGDSYDHYLDTLFGNRTVNHTGDTGSVVTTAANLGIQQRGFHNMVNEWFGVGTHDFAAAATLYSVWPKDKGVQHIETFRKMALADDAADRIKACLVWGQNPAVTEPNQTKVREGLKNLDTLVVVDMFATETALCDRKSSGWTYLIPACAHVEEAGSVTNSGRWIQWRERARAPKGKSKADLELLLRFAYSLDKAGAFAHITNVAYNAADNTAPSTGVWSSAGIGINGPMFKNLYEKKYGWSPSGGSAFEDVTAKTERWAPGATAPSADYDGYGSEIIAERVFKEMARPLDYLADGTASSTTGGTLWIYSGVSPAGGFCSAASGADNYPAGFGAPWRLKNRAKCRDNVTAGGAKTYSRWGWSWLYNRRVFYNNVEVPNDQADNFVGPPLVSQLFTTNPAGDKAYGDWNGAYRKFKTFTDQPTTCVSGGSGWNAASPHFTTAPSGGLDKGVTFAGRFAAHTEPYESPRADLTAKWGNNTSSGASLVLSGTERWTTPDSNMLVLTSIRCVEHFQGGPITRNNEWNVEAEPEPWIEINPVDARRFGIANGDLVNVWTARGSSTQGTSPSTTGTGHTGAHNDQELLTPTYTGWARGFRARVDSSIEKYQRVAPGVVAIPWHWGDKGLSKGSRANDLCIDAFDANSQIPEYKACLCKIEKAAKQDKDY